MMCEKLSCAIQVTTLLTAAALTIILPTFSHAQSTGITAINNERCFTLCMAVEGSPS